MTRRPAVPFGAAAVSLPLIGALGPRSRRDLAEWPAATPAVDRSPEEPPRRVHHAGTVPCVFRVVIDGEIQQWGTSLDVLDPDEVATIEVYLGTSS